MQNAGIEELMIEDQPHAFYKVARSDPLIGPDFEAKFEHWPPLSCRHVRLGSSATRMERPLTPMQAHAPLPIGDEHFER